MPPPKVQYPNNSQDKVRLDKFLDVYMYLLVLDNISKFHIILLMLSKIDWIYIEFDEIELVQGQTWNSPYRQNRSAFIGPQNHIQILNHSVDEIQL